MSFSKIRRISLMQTAHGHALQADAEGKAGSTSGSMPQPSSTFGCTIPAPSSSIQPSPWQVEQT